MGMIASRDKDGLSPAQAAPARRRSRWHWLWKLPLLLALLSVARCWRCLHRSPILGVHGDPQFEALRPRHGSALHTTGARLDQWRRQCRCLVRRGTDSSPTAIRPQGQRAARARTTPAAGAPVAPEPSATADKTCSCERAQLGGKGRGLVHGVIGPCGPRAGSSSVRTSPSSAMASRRAGGRRSYWAGRVPVAAASARLATCCPAEALQRAPAGPYVQRRRAGSSATCATWNGPACR